MKNVLKYAAIAALCLSAVSLTGCKHEEYDTDQYAGAVVSSASWARTWRMSPRSALPAASP